MFRQVYFTTYEVVRHNLGPESDLYRRLGPEKGELVRNMSAGATSSTVMQCFTVPLDIIGQARYRQREINRVGRERREKGEMEERVGERGVETEARRGRE